MADFKGKWEDNMINNIPKSIKDIEKKVLPVIREKANSELYNNMRNGTLDNTSVNINNNPNANPNTMNSPEQAKVRTLVRENNAPKVVNNTPEPTSSSDNRVNDYSHIPSDNPFESLRNNGNATSSTVLIVIAAFVIVAMLIVICLTLLGMFDVNI